MTLTETLLANKLQVAIAGLVLVGGAGATWVALGGDIPFLSGSDEMADRVPADVDFVLYVDPNIGDDQATAALVNGMIDATKDHEGEDYDGPDDYEEWLDRAQSNLSDDGTELDLDLDELNSVVAYARYDDGDDSADGDSEATYGAVLVDSEWDEADFVDAVGQNGSLVETDYRGYTLYEPADGDDAENETWVGVLEEGVYVVGTEAAVTDAIDVDRGGSDAFSGELRAAYDDTRSGDNTYLKFAGRLPDEDELGTGGMQLTDDRFGAIKSISVVSGSYYTTDSEVGMQLRFVTGSSGDASDLASFFEFGVTLANQSVASDEAREMLDDAEVEQDGDTVTVTFQSPVEEVVEAYDALLDEMADLSDAAMASAMGTANPARLDAEPAAETTPVAA
jgi:hypothetical protein